MPTTTAPPRAHRITDRLSLPASDAPLVARADRSDRYPIHITRSRAELLDQLQRLTDGNCAVLTDDNVEALYGAELVASLRRAPRDVLALTIAPGERSKSLEQAVRAWHWLAGSRMGRRDVLIAFGGGVVCDLAGWVASGYMRGIPYVNVPTTLLAMVDGALGGKVAVDHAEAKNLLGAFYQPRAVVTDVSYLRSLDLRQIRAGIAECVKKAMIASPAYWSLIEESADALIARDLDALEALVRGAAAIKTALIARDPYEHDLRRPLNFGHTIGHPLETVTHYGPLLHGEAVALGMVVEARIATTRGLLDEALEARLTGLLRRLGLPVSAADLPVRVDAAAVLRAMDKVRQIRDGSLRCVLPADLGSTVIADDVGDEEIRAALLRCGIR